MRCRCGRFTKGFCQTCWNRQVRKLLTQIHAAKERAGLCSVNCVWWV